MTQESWPQDDVAAWIAGMNQHTCAWIFLSSLNVENERLRGDPAEAVPDI
jgi:hypothetical protein